MVSPAAEGQRQHVGTFVVGIKPQASTTKLVTKPLNPQTLWTLETCNSLASGNSAHPLYPEP